MSTSADRAAAKAARWAQQRLQRRQAIYDGAPGGQERFEAASDWLRAARPGEAVFEEAAAYIVGLARAADTATANPPPPGEQMPPSEHAQGAGMGRGAEAQVRAHARNSHTGSLSREGGQPI